MDGLQFPILNFDPSIEYEINFYIVMEIPTSRPLFLLIHTILNPPPIIHLNPFLTPLDPNNDIIIKLIISTYSKPIKKLIETRTHFIHFKEITFDYSVCRLCQSFMQLYPAICGSKIDSILL